MEYIFKLSPQLPQTVVSLHPNHLVVQQGKVEEVIAYANIHQVRLFRAGGAFHVILYCLHHKSIHISNRFYYPDGRFDDFSRAYASFVRVLHFHLKDKSQSTYSCGLSRERLWVSIVFLMAAGLGVTYFFSFHQAVFENPLLPGAAAFGIMSLVFIFLVKNRIPRSYDPEQIPFRYLPSESSFVTQ